MYPIIYDAEAHVLSMPPIIDSNDSNITLNTTNVLVDVTAADQTKLDIVVDMVVTMFSEYCAQPFTSVIPGLFFWPTLLLLSLGLNP